MSVSFIRIVQHGICLCGVPYIILCVVIQMIFVSIAFFVFLGLTDG